MQTSRDVDRSGGGAREYATRLPVVRHVIVCVIGFLFFLALEVLHIFLMVISDAPHSTGMLQTAVRIFPMLMMFYCAGYLIAILRFPLRAVVDGEGLTIVGMFGRRWLAWREIAELRQGSVGSLAALMLQRQLAKREITLKTLELRDERGKKLAALPGVLADFDALGREIRTRSEAARGPAALDASKYTEIAGRDVRKQALTMAVLGGFLLTMSILSAVVLLPDFLREHRLYSEGVTVEATVARLYTYNVTPRVEYTWTDAAGQSHNRDTNIRRSDWDELAEGEAVPVLTLPDHPDTSRLAFEGREHSIEESLLVAFGALAMFLLGGGALAMYFMGIRDIDLKGGKLRLVRIDDPPELPAFLKDTAGEGSAPAQAGAGDAPGAMATVAAPFASGEPDVLIDADVFAGAAPSAAARVRAQQEETAGAEARGVLPLGVKILGGANLVFGLGMLAAKTLLFIGIMIFGMSGGSYTSEAAEMTIQAGTLDIIHSGLDHLIKAALGLVLTVAAIGLLMRREWGRIASIVTGWLLFLLGAWSIYTMVLMLMDESVIDPSLGEETVVLYRLAGAIAILFTVLCTLYPLVMALLLGRKSVRAEFQGP